MTPSFKSIAAGNTHDKTIENHLNDFVLEIEANYIYRTSNMSLNNYVMLENDNENGREKESSDNEERLIENTVTLNNLYLHYF